MRIYENYNDFGRGFNKELVILGHVKTELQDVFNLCFPTTEYQTAQASNLYSSL
jgi:hypothetical protein